MEWRSRRRASTGERLSAFLLGERAAIVRRWRRELRAAALSPPDFDTVLAPLVDELQRVTAPAAPGQDAALVFGECVAGRGEQRYRERARLRDAEREVSLLETAVVRVWADKRGDLPGDIALLVGCIVGEAVVRVARDYARAAEAGEAQLRLSSLVPALAQLAEVVIALDRRGAVTLAAGPVEELLGTRAAELVGKNADELTRARGNTAGLRALRTGEPVAAERTRLRNATSGEERVCETRAFPLRDEASGSVVGAVELIRDVTKEVQRDEELRRVDRELTALHGRLLRRAHAQAMSELATATAGALNNELNAIAMSLKLVAAELPPPRPESAARHLHAIDEAVQRGAQLIQRMQQLAARQPNAPPRAVPLNDVLMESLDLVRPELAVPGAGKTRAMRIDARLGPVGNVLAQATELRELLCTLLLDARDALGHGGVLQLSTRVERDGASVLLTHALGDETAPPGDDPRAPSERATTLAAARERARRWGGELAVDSRGGAMTVRLTLPAAPREATPATSGARPALRAARRVLVVDDDAGNRESLTELLALSGYDVRAAASGEEALAELARGPFEAALVDLAMPDMDGLELAARLRERAPATRVALVTGWEPEALPSARRGLVDAVFRKPIDLGAILAFLDAPAPAGTDAAAHG